ncbi:MAG: hypothetical protein ACOCUS_06605, partial [Polyangiales bacterium]
LTGTVLLSVRRVGAGRAALSSLHPSDAPRLARRYRQEYGSTLFTPREIAGWARWLARLAGGSGGDGRNEALAEPGDALPLPFPNRVQLELVDGRRERERVDLPVGSLASPLAAEALERKVLREVGQSVGEERARSTLEAGLDLEGAHPRDVLQPRDASQVDARRPVPM